MQGRGASTPAVILAPGSPARIQSATYQLLQTPPAAILHQIATRGFGEFPEDLSDDGNSGAGTTINLTVATALTGTAANGAALNPSSIFGVYIQVGFQDSPSGTMTVTVGWNSHQGQPMDQVIQIRYPPGGFAGSDLHFIVLPGIDVRGSREYAPAIVNDVHTSAANISLDQEVTVDFAGLPNQTSAIARLLNRHHEDCQVVQRHWAAMVQALDASLAAAARL